MDRARASAGQMGRLIDSLLRLAQVSRRLINCTPVDLSLLATAAIDRLRSEFPNRTVETTVRPGIGTVGDADLLDIVVTSLIDNAWKFTRPNPAARIEFGCESDQFVVSDNGVGFDMAHYDKLFGLCQRLHHESEFEGSGIGLATSQRIIRRHGGRIWAESVVGQGSTFRFTIPPMRNERA
jgi:signal transduction histidine kinase